VSPPALAPVLQEMPTHQGTQLLQARAPQIILDHHGGATAAPIKSALLDLPMEMFTGICHHLGLRGLVRIAATCKRFRHGEGGLETLRLPTKSPVVTKLRALAFPRLELASRMRPLGCSESWVAYLARCARQHRCSEAPPIAAGGSVQSVRRCGRSAARVRQGCPRRPRCC
jgi:hypothetical protein